MTQMLISFGFLLLVLSATGYVIRYSRMGTGRADYPSLGVVLSGALGAISLLLWAIAVAGVPFPLAVAFGILGSAVALLVVALVAVAAYDAWQDRRSPASGEYRHT
ncbi:MAG: hypothetical protein L0H59_09180 [Tomitella sp.]|nr:hypothetical protein [Tomitella sp.]